MAMTQLAVLWMLSIAVILSLGLVRDFEDAATSLLLGFTSAIFWGVGGLSAYSVHAQAWSGSRAMEPLAILSIGVAVLVGLLTMYELVVTVRKTTGATETAVID